MLKVIEDKIKSLSPSSEVFINKDPVEALKDLQEKKIDPQAIIIDQNMPKMTGLEFIHIVSSQFPEIKILLLTASSKLMNSQESIPPQVQYLPKPICDKDLNYFLISI